MSANCHLLWRNCSATRNSTFVWCLHRENVRERRLYTVHTRLICHPFLSLVLTISHQLWISFRLLAASAYGLRNQHTKFHRILFLRFFDILFSATETDRTTLKSVPCALKDIEKTYISGKCAVKLGYSKKRQQQWTRLQPFIQDNPGCQPFWSFMLQLPTMCWSCPKSTGWHANRATAHWRWPDKQWPRYFMPDALTVATLPINPRLGPAPEYTGYVPSGWGSEQKTKQRTKQQNILFMYMWILQFSVPFLKYFLLAWQPVDVMTGLARDEVSSTWTSTRNEQSATLLHIKHYQKNKATAQAHWRCSSVLTTDTAPVKRLQGLLLRDSLSLSRSFLLWLQPWSLSTIMLL